MLKEILVLIHKLLVWGKWTFSQKSYYECASVRTIKTIVSFSQDMVFKTNYFGYYYNDKNYLI